MTAVPPPRKIGDLQVLRGVAILLVLLDHAPLTGAVVGRLAHPIAFPGWLGVDLFFVISGYVISRTLARDRFEPLAFFARRVFRLTPALLLLIALTAGVLALADRGLLPGVSRGDGLPTGDRFGPLATSILCGYYCLGPLDGGPLLGMAWSLSVEDLFYAALTGVCLVAALALRRRAPRVLPGVLTALAAAVYLTLLWMRLEYLTTGRITAAAWRPMLYLFVLRFDLLALGVVLGFIDGKFGASIGRAVAGRGPFWTPILLGGPLALAAVCDPVSSLARSVLGLVVPVAGACFGLLVLAAAHEAATPPTRGWAYRGWTYLGDRSYSIYLFHPLAILAAWVVLRAFGDPSALLGSDVRVGLVHAAVAAAILVPLVELIYRGVELPLTAVGRRLSHRLRIIPADPAPAAPPLALPLSRAA